MRAEHAPPARGGRPSFAGAGCVTAVVLFILLFLVVPALLDVSVDWQWFGSLGLQSVFGRT